MLFLLLLFLVVVPFLNSCYVLRVDTVAEKRLLFGGMYIQPKRIWTRATSTNGMWCTPELKSVHMVRLSIMVGHNISALNIHVSVLVPCK